VHFVHPKQIEAALGGRGMATKKKSRSVEKCRILGEDLAKRRTLTAVAARSRGEGAAVQFVRFVHGKK